MVERLKSKTYAAVISDDTQLISRAYNDQSCSLHILSESVEPFDLAFAFSTARPCHLVICNASVLHGLETVVL